MRAKQAKGLTHLQQKRFTERGERPTSIELQTHGTYRRRYRAEEKACELCHTKEAYQVSRML